MRGTKQAKLLCDKTLPEESEKRRNSVPVINLHVFSIDMDVVRVARQNAEALGVTTESYLYGLIIQSIVADSIRIKKIVNKNRGKLKSAPDAPGA